MWLSRRWKQWQLNRLKSQTWQWHLFWSHNTSNSHRAVGGLWANCTSLWTLSYLMPDAYLVVEVGLCVWFLALTYRYLTPYTSMEYFSIVPRVEHFTIPQLCFAYRNWAVPRQWSGRWFWPLLKVQTITICMFTLDQWVTITNVVANCATALVLVLMCYMLYTIYKDWPRDWSVVVATVLASSGIRHLCGV